LNSVYAKVSSDFENSLMLLKQKAEASVAIPSESSQGL
jgi:hypothetical protein